jgi:exodeoxyribonuclease VII small subunit
MTVKKITYSEAIAEIEAILEKIENEELDVDDLADKVARVSFLLKLCKEKLQKTNDQVEKILDELDK